MNIFEYSNIFYLNIYSDIHSYQNFNTNIFGYSFVSKMFIQIYSDIRSYHFLDTNIFGYSFVSKSIRMSHSGLGGECATLASVEMRELCVSGLCLEHKSMKMNCASNFSITVFISL